jgi:hypothetical protein
MIILNDNIKKFRKFSVIHMSLLEEYRKDKEVVAL